MITPEVAPRHNNSVFFWPRRRFPACSIVSAPPFATGHKQLFDSPDYLYQKQYRQMETDNNIQIGIDELTGLVLESLAEYEYRASRLDESPINNAAQMLDAFRSGRDSFLKSDAYARLSGAIKGVLAKHGISATMHDQITGKPRVEKTDDHDRRMAMQDTVGKIRSKILELNPSYSKYIPENADDTSKLMKPVEQNGKLGLKCSTIGELSRDIQSMNGKGLSVIQTDSRQYGFEPYTFIETDWFITLPDGAQSVRTA